MYIYGNFTRVEGGDGKMNLKWSQDLTEEICQQALDNPTTYQIVHVESRTYLLPDATKDYTFWKSAEIEIDTTNW